MLEPEGWIILGLIGAFLGAATGAVWYAGDLLLHTATLDYGRFLALVILGVVFLPIGISIAIARSESQGRC